MKLFGYISVCVFIFLGSCTRKVSDNVLTIDIDSLEAEKPLFRLEIEKYIPLETNDDMLIGHVDKIVPHDDKFLISDIESDKLFMFDEQGKNLWCLSKQGRGPGEYIALSDFTLDNDGNLYVLCSSTANILKYSAPDYEFEDLLQLKTNVTEICQQDDILWAANLFNYNENAADGLAYLFQSGDTEIVIPFRKDFDGLSPELSSKPQSFYPGRSLLFNQRMSPDVYRLNNKSAEKIFSIKSKYLALSGHPDTKTKSVNGFFSLFETNRFIAGVLWTNYSLYRDILVYDLTTYKASLINGYENISGFSNIFATNGTNFYTIVSPELLIEQKNKDEKLNELMSKITIDSNPIIVEFSIHNIEVD